MTVTIVELGTIDAVDLAASSSLQHHRLIPAQVPSHADRKIGMLQCDDIDEVHCAECLSCPNLAKLSVRCATTSCELESITNISSWTWTAGQLGTPGWTFFTAHARRNLVFYAAKKNGLT